MKFEYNDKVDEKEIINFPKPKFKINLKKFDNLLMEGDNLTGLRALLETKIRFDLCYIDPPFATGNSFHTSSERVATISKASSDKLAYSDEVIGDKFIEFIRQRIILIKNLLTDKGSFYLHIDYKIGHYVKIICDEVFGIGNFINDITRIKSNPKNFNRRAYGNQKDLILFYSKNNKHIWNENRIPLTENDIKKLYKKEDSSGRKYTTVPLHAPGETSKGDTAKKWKGMLPPKGRHWRSSPKELDRLDKEGLIEWSLNGNPRKKIYVDEHLGKKAQDIWEFKDPSYPLYPTEKNFDLLKFIISSSSDENSYVLDCFAGSGTSLIASHCLKRKWVGIDQSKEAIKVIKKKLQKNKIKEFEYLKIK